MPVKWEQFVGDDFFNLILVEPDQDQVKDITKMYPAASIIPYALGDINGNAILNITVAQSCSSILEPDAGALSRFPVKEAFRVIDKVPVEIYRFDDLILKHKLDPPAFVKIDVQGYEYAVLNGFGEALDSVLCIELETHLVPIYKGEKSLTGINDFLNSKGFYLRHLETAGLFEGEVMEFNAYFVKRKKYLKGVNDKKLVRFWENVNRIPPARRFLGSK
ncbi:FkbM family methyltransferase [Mucilaginibacter angelicae]|uniref:FkbM family methyltransferase n=1 Tax=Mucilaginibacter angelicae TaxID=869718 RepID=A0ABV6L1K5_9SPHI